MARHVERRHIGPLPAPTIMIRLLSGYSTDFGKLAASGSHASQSLDDCDPDTEPCDMHVDPFGKTPVSVWSCESGRLG